MEITKRRHEQDARNGGCQESGSLGLNVWDDVQRLGEILCVRVASLGSRNGRR